MKNIRLSERLHDAIAIGRDKGRRLFIYFLSMNQKSKETMIGNKFQDLNSGSSLIECDELIKQLINSYKTISGLSKIENQISRRRAAFIFREFNTMLNTRKNPIKLSEKQETEFDISTLELLDIIKKDRESYKNLLIVFIKAGIRNEVAKLVNELNAKNIKHQIELESLNYNKLIQNIHIR